MPLAEEEGRHRVVVVPVGKLQVEAVLVGKLPVELVGKLPVEAHIQAPSAAALHIVAVEPLDRRVVLPGKAASPFLNFFFQI